MPAEQVKVEQRARELLDREECSKEHYLTDRSFGTYEPSESPLVPRAAALRAIEAALSPSDDAVRTLFNALRECRDELAEQSREWNADMAVAAAHNASTTLEGVTFHETPTSSNLPAEVSTDVQGWREAPIEPTEAMWSAAWDASEDYFVGDDVSAEGFRRGLSAMLAAAPVHSITIGEE